MLFYAAKFSGIYHNSKLIRKLIYILKQSWSDLLLEKTMAGQAPNAEDDVPHATPPASLVALGTRVCFSVAG